MDSLPLAPSVISDTNKRNVSLCVLNNPISHYCDVFIIVFSLPYFSLMVTCLCVHACMCVCVCIKAENIFLNSTTSLSYSIQLLQFTLPVFVYIARKEAAKQG